MSMHTTHTNTSIFTWKHPVCGCRASATVISQIRMLEVLRRRGLLREQNEWRPMYDFEVLVMYRVLVLYMGVRLKNRIVDQI